MSDWRSRSMNRLASFTRQSPSTASSPAPGSHKEADLSSMALPEEIDRSVQAFLNNLTNPVHKAPFSPERLTNMFQDFYAGMEELVHDSLPDDTKAAETGEMFSTEEIAQQKLKRGLLETKRIQWREEIESRVCEDMYDRIFELKTSTDEVRDEALMSKIIAMNLIGVSLEQLGVGLSESQWKAMQPTITLIGEELQSLNNVVTPKAKLDILVACHKQIVAEVQHSDIVDGLADAVEQTEAESHSQENDVLAQEANDRKQLGADAILPILIYAIIKSNPAKLVSHFEFIQRFRSVNLLVGEAAYCLTNVEAAIGFLETFDNNSNSDLDPLRSPLTTNSHLKSSMSTSSLSSSIRAGERARALSSAAQEVYDFADERMKSLGSQFGLQLNNLVGRVSQSQDVDDVRSLMGLPAAMNSSNEETPAGIIASPRKGSVSSASSSLRRDFRSASPSKGTDARPAGRLSGFGMIRNISNSFSASRTREAQKQGTREMQVIASGNQSKTPSTRERSLSDASSLQPAADAISSDRFLNLNADDLTLRDVRELLAEYKRLRQGLS